MESGQDSVPTSAPSQRAVFPPSPRPKAPEHELRDRAKAAKLRHKAARARVKANRLQDRSRYLFTKATTMERRADELDGIVRTPVPESSTREFRSGGRGHVEIRRDRAAARHDLVHVLCFKIQRPDGAVCLRELAHTHPAPPRSLIRDKAFVKRPRRF